MNADIAGSKWTVHVNKGPCIILLHMGENGGESVNYFQQSDIMESQLTSENKMAVLIFLHKLLAERWVQAQCQFPRGR
jgi:hypothetical protein